MAIPTTETNGTDFLENTTLKQILGIPDSAMDQAMGIAYQLYINGRFAEAEIVCKGLLACDHRYWWSHSLHASVLRRLGRTEEALGAVEEGLKYEPRQPKLSLMRTELMIARARLRDHRGQDRRTGRRIQPAAAGPRHRGRRVAVRKLHTRPQNHLEHNIRNKGPHHELLLRDRQ